MARKKVDAAAELAERMIQVLEAQRRLGADSYPLRLRRLVDLIDPATDAALPAKAVKKKPFDSQLLVIDAKDLDTPIALAEDAEAFADSTLVLEYLLDRLCGPEKPTFDVAQLTKKAPRSMQPAFAASLERRIQENRLPAGVGLVLVKNKRHLHLQRYPIPRPEEEVLADDLLRVLEAQRRLGADSYPVEQNRLVELTRPGVADGLLKKALALPQFKQAVVQTPKGTPKKPAENPLLALAADAEMLADSPRLLEGAMRSLHGKDNQVFAVADLAKQVETALRKAFEQAIARRIDNGNLPAGIGSLRQKGKPVLFFTSDVQGAAKAPAVQPPTANATTPEGPDFAQAFEEAFQRLDRQRGGHNHVSLADLRRALPVDRTVFDAELNRLRRMGRFTLSSSEGRYELKPEEREAAIVEDGAQLLYVSRKLS